MARGGGIEDEVDKLPGWNMGGGGDVAAEDGDSPSAVEIAP